MQHFQRALAYVNEHLYARHNWTVSDVSNEPQNADYGAGVFLVNTTSVRFRVARTTPKKIGQFVAFWQKNEQQQNEAFTANDAPQLLVIHTTSGEQAGQFVFPKSVLVEKGILTTANKAGKMAMRVYPSWDVPTSKQAIATQKWQLPYFVSYEEADDKLRALYNM